MRPIRYLELWFYFYYVNIINIAKDSKNKLPPGNLGTISLKKNVAKLYVLQNLKKDAIGYLSTSSQTE